MTHETQRHRPDLKGLVVRGVGWMMASQAATYVLALVTSVLIARFLGPREVGLAAEALVFGSLALVIVDFGFASAIVQRPTLTEADKSTAFWAGMMLGVVLMLAGIGLSWPIADLYGEPRVQPLFATLSLAFLFTAPGIVQGGLLTRELGFRSLQIRTVIATTVSCATGISLAVAGFGAWAIVAQDLVITGVSTALLWRVSPWRPQATFSMASLRSMAAYTSHVFGTRALVWATLNLDNFLIGRYLGASPLGAYTIAFSLMTTPLKRIASPLTNVLFPAFSRMREPDRIASAWLRATRMIALVVVPITFGVVPVAPELVETAFGDQWDAAVPLIQILAAVGLIHSLVALNDGVLQALGRTRILFRFTAVLSVLSVGAFAFALQWGVEGVAWAYLIVTVALQPVLVWLTARQVDISPRDWLRSIAGVVQAGALMLAVVFLAREILLETGLGAGLRLLALIVIGAATYAPLVHWRAPEVRGELRALLRRLDRAPDGSVLSRGEGAV